MDPRNLSPLVRAQEIAEFLQLPIEQCIDRVTEGFFPNHKHIAVDFRQANPLTNEELLQWYRTTDGYIFELTTYHLQPEFNHYGMLEGIAVHLRNAKKKKVLCLGDGVGDLSLTLHEYGLNPVYHDLARSKTAAFAQYRFAQYEITIQTALSEDWVPKFRKNCYDAVVALDFIEHLPEPQVEPWTKAIYNGLKKDGYFLAQNAFGVGVHNMEGEESSIPMHDTGSEHYTQDWTPLLESIGFRDLNNSWWVK